MEHPQPDPGKPPSSSGGRSLTVDDLFRVQHVRNPVFSPDSHWLAFEVTRPVGEERVRRLTAWDQIHCDVWLAAVAEGEPRNLTESGQTGEGFWNPIWSPGSKRLAMLCFSEGRIRVRIWEAATGTLWPLEDLAIKHQHWLDGLAWLSDRKLAAITWPPGSSEPCRMRVAARLGEGPSRRWPGPARPARERCWFSAKGHGRQRGKPRTRSSGSRTSRTAAGSSWMRAICTT